MTAPSLSPADARVTAAATLRVYDPAMCCSTGVCGPDVDPELVRFAADLDWLKGEGVAVERFNLAQQPAAFAAEPLARRVLQDVGEAGLPLILVDGVAKSSGTYPPRALLAEWVHVTVAPGVWDEKVAELAAIAAAVAANCVSCLSAHEQAARTLGISAADMRRAMEAGRAVRDASVARVEQHATRLLERKRMALPVNETHSPCCGPSPASGGGPASSSCC